VGIKCTLALLAFSNRLLTFVRWMPVDKIDLTSVQDKTALKSAKNLENWYGHF